MTAPHTDWENNPSVRPGESGDRPGVSAGPVNASAILVRALVAYSVHEHQDEAGAATRVSVKLQPRSCCVEDNGRGMGLHRDGYVAGLLEQLAATRSEVALHGIGLAIVAMSSPCMTVESRRGGLRFTQDFAWGVVQGPVQGEPWDGATGTRVTFTLPDDAPEIAFDQVIAQVDQWRAAHRGFELTCRSMHSMRLNKSFATAGTCVRAGRARASCAPVKPEGGCPHHCGRAK